MAIISFINVIIEKKKRFFCFFLPSLRLELDFDHMQSVEKINIPTFDFSDHFLDGNRPDNDHESFHYSV